MDRRNKELRMVALPLFCKRGCDEKAYEPINPAPLEHYRLVHALSLVQAGIFCMERRDAASYDFKVKSKYERSGEFLAGRNLRLTARRRTALNHDTARQTLVQSVLMKKCGHLVMNFSASLMSVQGHARMWRLLQRVRRSEDEA